MIYLTITPNKEFFEMRTQFIRKKQMYCKVRIMIYGVFTGSVIGFTPVVFQYANMQRASPALGGELFFPILPIIIYPIFDMCCDAIWRKMVKRWRKKNNLKIK